MRPEQGTLISRAQAMAALLELLTDQPLIVCNGFPSREVQKIADRPTHFYMWTLRTLRGLGLHVAFLESREEKLRSLDEIILNFYTQHRSAFYAATALYLLGWLAEALEVYVIILYLGGPASLLSAIPIGALSVFIKGGTFFIPGSLGAQDGGNLLLLKAFGYSDVTGITFALLRRFRELVWIGIGLVCLAAMGRGQKRDTPKLG